MLYAAVVIGTLRVKTIFEPRGIFRTTLHVWLMCTYFCHWQLTKNILKKSFREYNQSLNFLSGSTLFQEKLSGLAKQ